MNSLGAPLKDYIRGRRGESLTRLRYILLFGDVELIPPEVTTGLWGSNITDYYYSTKADSSVSDPHPMAWLSIGRIPMKTAEEGMKVVKKIIDYERNPPGDPEYYRKLVFGAYFEDDDNNGQTERGYMQCLEAIRNQLTLLGLEVERVYVTNSSHPTTYVDGTPVPGDVKAAMVPEPSATSMLVSAVTEGKLIAAHRDHGEEAGWYEPHFQSDELDSIHTTVPTIFYSINCLTGMMDSTTPAECFAEHALLMDGGPPTLIAATRVSHTWLNDDLMKGIFDGTWGGVLNTFPGTTASYPVCFNRIGDLLNYAKTYLPAAMSANDAAVRDHYEIYHVVGDPSLEIWKATPRVLKLTVNYVPKRKSVLIQLADCPRYSVITVWRGSTLLKRLEPSSTSMWVPIAPVVFGPGIRTPYSVCFWAPGCRFLQVFFKPTIA